MMKSMYYTATLELNVPFSILNSQDGNLVTVGTITNGVVAITGDIVYPGGATAAPDNSLAALTIIDTNSFIDGDGNYWEWMWSIKIGADIAVAEVNAIPILVPQF